MDLPQGWAEEKQEYMPHCAVLKHGSNGYVTIDFEKRIFSLGMGRPQAWRESRTYAGRGWQTRIVADAIASLMRAINSENLAAELMAQIRVLPASERVIQREEPCATCNGSGWVTRDADIGTDRECSVCDGKGRISDA